MDLLEKNSSNLRIITFYSDRITQENFVENQNDLDFENYVIGVNRFEFGP